MGHFLIVHFSDFHFNNETFFSKNQINKIFNIVKSKNCNNLIFAFTGDLTFSGSKNEYNNFNDFITNIDENFKVNIVDILANAYVNVVSYDEKKDVFELDHSSFFVKEEEKIKVGNIYSATIMGCNQFCAFCRLQDGNLVRVDKANMVPRNITDVRKIYIRGDKVKLVISRIYDYNEVTKYVGSFIVPGRKFTGKVGQYVRARVEAKKFNEDNKVFAVVLDCGEEREGELYLNDDKNPSEGDIVIVKIKRIVGNKIKLRFQD